MDYKKSQHPVRSHESKMLVLLILTTLAQISNQELLYENKGDVNIGVLIENCVKNQSPQRTLINTAIWTVDRLNNVKSADPLQIGLSVFGACADDDYLKGVFEMYKNRGERYLLGIVGVEEFPEKVQEFMQVIGVHYKQSPKYVMTLIKAVVKVLWALNWVEDLSVIAPNQSVLRELYRQTRKDWMCITKFIINESDLNLDEINLDKPLVILGTSHNIHHALNHLNISSTNETKIVLVPFDGAEIHNAPDGSYIIQPPYSDRTQTPDKPQKILPSPLLFEISNPIISYTRNITDFINQNCNDTVYKLNCFRNEFKPQLIYEILPQETLLKTLKITPLANEFIYNVFRVENLSKNASEAEYLNMQNYIKTFTYSIIDNNLTVLEQDADKSNESICVKDFENCLLKCENFKSFELSSIFSLRRHHGLNLREEPWVYAFLSLSSLGAVFCISISIFIIVRLCRRSVLEGNPILTILLLLAVFAMYLSVVAFSLEVDKFSRKRIYLARALGVTVPYSFAFALLLARTILLATVSKEVGFMSHIAGTVQAFLSLFIFAVQLALSLQLAGDCEDIFRGYSLVYLLSYNVILLVLLLLITPLVTKSQRNYREGKYFTISVIVLAITWSCWLPGYAVLDEYWKDPLLCLGLVSTASILLGAIFIPRTYLMTVSAARERFTSALPSLATATSAMDIYRASTQPVYDCVNVAAINAASSLRSGSAPPPPQPDFYSAPDDDDDEFEVTQCYTPPPDKVTRF